MTTPRRPFNYAQFVTRWRWLCDMYGLDAKTSYVLEYEWAYKLDDRGVRRLMRVPVAPEREPECLVDDQAGTWWARPELWHEAGRNHSSTEAAALANVAAQARRARGVERPKSNIEIFGEVFLEGAADRHAATAARRAEIEARRARRDLPLRERYAAEGKTVEEVAGKRMLVNARENVA